MDLPATIKEVELSSARRLPSCQIPPDAFPLAPAVADAAVAPASSDLITDLAGTITLAFTAGFLLATLLRPQRLFMQ